MRQILCVSTASYRPFPSRKQNVMERLSDAEIIYIDPPVSYLAPLKDKSAKAKLKAYKEPGERVKDNITVYAAPPVLPFFNKYRIINRWNQKRLARYVKKRLKENGFGDPYIWCYSPTSCDLVDRVSHKGLIYDCVDRHSAYPGLINPAVVDKMEEDLAKKCDMVFCTAQGLYETLVQYNSDTAMIPNGANYELFSKAAEGEKKEQKPVFGFVGMMQECINYDYIKALAEVHPDWEVRFVGRSLPGVDLKGLDSMDNVKLLGLFPQPELPDQIREFDVCLNVFQEGKLSRDVSPLKFYEYLATGKPVVSTKEPLQVMDYADVTYIAGSREEFLQKCQEALAEKDPGIKTRRMACGKACSWDERVKQMEQILKEKGIFLSY